jgi:hypothetical protein
MLDGVQLKVQGKGDGDSYLCRCNHQDQLRQKQPKEDNSKHNCVGLCSQPLLAVVFLRLFKLSKAPIYPPCPHS